MLMHPSNTSPIFHKRNGIDGPLAFYSRQLRRTELSYSAYDKELLAIYLSVRSGKTLMNEVYVKEVR